MTETLTKTNPKTFDELFEAVKNGEIISAKDKDGKVYRFFISTTEALCYFRKGSRRSGPYFPHNFFEDLVSFEFKETEEERKTRQEREKYNDIAKYRKMAMQASFTNSFNEDCKKLPASFAEWVKDGKKSLFEYSITTGNKIDGKVISIERIGKQYRGVAEKIREAIKNQTKGHICSRYKFAGYEMTIEAYGEGEWKMALSLEYKDCGNGYYYLLINDENFIGYDVD